MLEGEAQSRRRQALATCLCDVEHAPPLRRMNGFGVGLYGSLSDPILPGGYWKMYWISALWIPLIPLGVYLVSPYGDGFRFHRKMGLIAFHRIYARRLPWFYLSVAGESLLLLTVVALVLVLLAFLMMGLQSVL
jgi:hypothetical protein